MSKINDGGPAFPISVQPDFQYAEAGMSLRDWFAGQALAGLIASGRSAYDLADSDQQAAYAAFRAYTAADAMLAARERQP